MRKEPKDKTYKEVLAEVKSLKNPDEKTSRQILAEIKAQKIRIEPIIRADILSHDSFWGYRALGSKIIRGKDGYDDPWHVGAIMGVFIISALAAMLGCFVMGYNKLGLAFFLIVPLVLLLFHVAAWFSGRRAVRQFDEKAAQAKV